MRVVSGLEAIQGVSRHDFPRQTVPVRSSSREERHRPVVCPAGGDVIAVVVVLPRATSAACWSWRIAGADGDEAMVEIDKNISNRAFLRHVYCYFVNVDWLDFVMPITDCLFKHTVLFV